MFLPNVRDQNSHHEIVAKIIIIYILISRSLDKCREDKCFELNDSKHFQIKVKV